MPRKPSVRYWPTRNGYCCKVGGKQHMLAAGPDDAPAGPTYLSALTAFHQLMEEGQLNSAGDSNTARVVLSAYLEHVQTARKPGTYRLRQGACALFCERWGTVPCNKLKPLHVNEIVAEMRQPRQIDGLT